ncbi:MAG: hypothetical protein J6F30_01190 [Cellulosilyticum sp.]|nr:hypothetical protein [Cellulosilyticum sp.]
MQAQESQKKPKTWDEAINELRGFIIQSKKEEQMKAAAEKEKAETQKEQQV